MEERIKNEEKQQAVNLLYNKAADLMINQKMNSWETKEELKKLGLDEAAAETVVNNLEQQITDAKKERANKDMLYGALWCVGGIVVTAATYSAASNGGGSYVVAWGAIIFGAIQFIKGVANAN